MKTIKEKYLAEASKSWLDHKVTHITPTGQRNQVKIKSLSPDERKRWSFIKKRYETFEPGDIDSVVDDVIEENGRFVTLYVAFKNMQGLDGLSRSDLSIGTNNTLIASELDDEYGVEKVHNIPIDAVIKYMVVDDNGDGEWEEPPIELDDDELKEFYMYGKDKKYVLNLFDYKDILHKETRNG